MTIIIPNRAALSIGIEREDGDFVVLATLNNNDEHLSDEQFVRLAKVSHDLWQLMLPDDNIVTLFRQDAPDYVKLGEDYDTDDDGNVLPSDEFIRSVVFGKSRWIKE